MISEERIPEMEWSKWGNFKMKHEKIDLNLTEVLL